MVPRRRRNDNENQEQQHDKDVWRSRPALFIQQVEKEVQDRLKELEGNLDTMMVTVDRVFKVEVMKVPQVLQKTRLGDLLSKEEIFSNEVSIIQNETLEMMQPLKRVSSKKAKSSQSTLVQRTTSKTSKGGKETKQTKTLAGSKSTGNMGCTSTPYKRSHSRVLKSQTKPKLRSVVSTGDIHCSMAAAAAHVSVTTGQGQTVSFSEETKEDLDLHMLDDVAWHHIQRLTTLMEEISKRRLK